MRDIQIVWRGPGPGQDEESLSLQEAFHASAEALRLAWSADRTALVATVGVNVAVALAELAQLRTGGAAMGAIVAGDRPTSQLRRAAVVGACSVAVVAGQTAGFVLNRSRSALLISHRLSSVRFADRICVLAGGRITETGTHDELLAVGGIYAELFELQAHAYR